MTETDPAVLPGPFLKGGKAMVFSIRRSVTLLLVGVMVLLSTGAVAAEEPIYVGPTCSRFSTTT